MRGGQLGSLLPASAKGHCGFVSSWSAPGDMCRAPASVHFLMDHPDGPCGMFACPDHAAAVLGPLDRHSVTDECVHPSSIWQTTAPNRPGFCFVPEEDTEILASLEAVTTATA